jgi:hypothetical protein
MSCVEYESVEVERSASEKGNGAQRTKPFPVPVRSGRHQDEVVRRVADILDFELAQGLMPS